MAIGRFVGQSNAMVREAGVGGEGERRARCYTLPLAAYSPTPSNKKR